MKPKLISICCIGHNKSLDKFDLAGKGFELVESPFVERSKVRLTRLDLLQRSSGDVVWFIDDDDVVLALPEVDFVCDEIRFLSLSSTGYILPNAPGLWRSIFSKRFLYDNMSMTTYLVKSGKEDYAFRSSLKTHTIHSKNQVIYQYFPSHRLNK